MHARKWQESLPKGGSPEFNTLVVHRPSHARNLLLDSRCSTHTCLDVVRPIARIGELADNHTAADLGCLDALLHRIREFGGQERLCAIFQEGFSSWTGEPGCANPNIPATKVRFGSNGTHVSLGEFHYSTASSSLESLMCRKRAGHGRRAVAFIITLCSQQRPAGYFWAPLITSTTRSTSDRNIYIVVLFKRLLIDRCSCPFSTRWTTGCSQARSTGWLTFTIHPSILNKHPMANENLDSWRPGKTGPNPPNTPNVA
jgi:hypothetical protein